MVIPNYTYLMLKMLGPAGTITVGTTVLHEYECKVECCDLAEGHRQAGALKGTAGRGRATDRREKDRCDLQANERCKGDTLGPLLH